METSLTIDYDKQWLNCVSAIGPWDLKKILFTSNSVFTLSGAHKKSPEKMTTAECV